jgi:hypothetical protein
MQSPINADATIKQDFKPFFITGALPFENFSMTGKVTLPKRMRYTHTLDKQGP